MVGGGDGEWLHSKDARETVGGPGMEEGDGNGARRRLRSRSKSSSNGVGLQSIPVASMKVVHRLKEILDYPECEVYAMLKECKLDPNETVHRLLSQDPFLKVTTKPIKRKENKDTTESKTC